MKSQATYKLKEACAGAFISSEGSKPVSSIAVKKKEDVQLLKTDDSASAAAAL